MTVSDDTSEDYEIHDLFGENLPHRNEKFSQICLSILKNSIRKLRTTMEIKEPIAGKQSIGNTKS